MASMGRDSEVLIPRGFEMNNLFFGAYDIMGRLEDIPLTTRDILDCRCGTNTTARFARLSQVGPSSGTYGFYCGEKSDHAPTPVIGTEEERQSRADSGRQAIDAIANQIDICNLTDQMKGLDSFTKEVISRFGSWLEFC